MSLTLLHGDNHFASRKNFGDTIASYKQRGFKDIIQFSGSKFDVSELIQAVETGSFFATQKLITLEKIHQKTNSKNTSSIIDFLHSLSPQDHDVLIWEDKTLTPTQLKKLSNFTPQVHKASKAIFAFLDSYIPQKPQAYVKSFTAAINQDSAEMVFYMLIKRVRILLELTDGTPKLAPWQLSKLKSQSGKWPTSTLLQLHAKLFQLDYDNKSGRLIGDFTSNLQYVVLSI